MHQQQPPPQWQAHQPQSSHFIDGRSSLAQQRMPQHKSYVQQEAQQQQNSNMNEHATSVLTASEVGAAFAVQYFKIMKNRPDDLPRFYAANCRVTRSSVMANGTLDSRTAASPTQVRELLLKEHGCGIGLSVAIINVIECQDAMAGGVFIHLTGVLRFVDDSSKSFTMSILLGREDNGGLGYFIFNDCLVFAVPSDPAESNRSQPAPAPQVSSLPQAAPAPVVAPAAATGQPAAAPLPTTTAPRLSGTASPVTQEEIIAEFKEPEVEHSTVEQPEVVMEEEEEEESVCKPKETVVQEQQNPVKSVWQSITPVEIKEDVFAMKSPSSMKAVEPQHSTSSTTRVSPTVSSVEPANYSRNSYAGALVHSGSLHTSRVGYSVPRPTQQPPPPSQGYGKPLTASTQQEEIDQIASRSNQKKSFETNSGMKQDQQRPRSARNKTLWISVIPTDLSDDKIKKAISDQLKGQATEGHVIRVERVPGAVHGYIELDTEACAKLLIERGLHLQGRAVPIDFPNRGNVGYRPSMNRGSRPRRSGELEVPPPSAATNITNGFTPRRNRNFRRNDMQNGGGDRPVLEMIEDGWTNASRRRNRKPAGNSLGGGTSGNSAIRNNSGNTNGSRRQRPDVAIQRRTNNGVASMNGVPKITDAIAKPVAQPVN